MGTVADGLRQRKNVVSMVFQDHSVAVSATVKQLRTIKFLCNVDESVIRALATKVHRRTFKANTALFHSGEPGMMLYMVVSGWVRIERVTVTGQTLVIAKRGPGTQLGELALFDGAPRSADAVTDTECEVISLDRKTFLDCLTESPTASIAVMASLADMVRQAGSNLESIRSLDVPGRLAELLLSYCETHGAALPGGAVKINIRVTHQSLADQVGVARETVTRTLRVFDDAKILSRHGQFLVVDDLHRLKQKTAG
jgi:CRP/FNR family cyclic AMP-dependent transcriptional regulator